MRNKIPNDIIPIVYQIAKRFYNNEIKLKEATNFLYNNYGLKPNSSTDYLYNYGHLLEGNEFKRTMNIYATEYYIKSIHNEFGNVGLNKAINSLNKHIEYYEGINNTKMHEMRFMVQKHSYYLNPPLVNSLDDLLDNIETLENYLIDGSNDERLYASNLVKRGTCFIAYQIKGEIRFAPSRFIGYMNNLKDKYSTKEIDGRDTNKVIKKILKSNPLINNEIEKEYEKYCIKLGIKFQPNGGAYAIKRKYWSFELEMDFSINNENSEDFPEGRIVERIHKSRERNSKVIKIAKQNYKTKYGKLTCQICEFDFEANYGEVGIDYIEGHHTIPVSSMNFDDKTKPEDIAMLCSNCHKMVHRRRPWLSMEQLSGLVLKTNKI